jgi:hypothetical protein
MLPKHTKADMVIDPLANLSTLAQFILLFMPGFVSTRTYDLLIAGPPRDYLKSIYEVIGYSMLNYALCSPVVLWWLATRTYRPLWETLLLALLVLFIVPMLLPIAFLQVLRIPWISSKVINPIPSAWDWAFGEDINPRAMVLLHLNDGRRIGGAWYGKSYVSTYPIPPDVYLSEVWNVDQRSGEFIDIVPYTQGIVIWGKDIQMVEFFNYEKVRTEANDRAKEAQPAKY